MKKILFLLFFTLTLFSSTGKVSAACASFTAVKNGSQVTLTATSCQGSNGDRYLIRIEKNGNIIAGEEATLANGTVEKTFYISETGNYQATLFDTNRDPIATTTFSLEEIETTPLTCGNPCNWDSKCPASCPATAGPGGQFYCGLLCSSENGTCVSRNECESRDESWVDESYKCPGTNLVCCLCCNRRIHLEQRINFAQIGQALPSLRDIFKPGPSTNVGAIINFILPYVFVIAGLLLLFYLIAGGFQLMTSANDEKGVASAKAKITNALIGFIILFVSFWLVQIIEFIFGIQIF